MGQKMVARFVLFMRFSSACLWRNLRNQRRYFSVAKESGSSCEIALNISLNSLYNPAINAALGSVGSGTWNSSPSIRATVLFPAWFEPVDAACVAVVAVVDVVDVVVSRTGAVIVALGGTREKEPERGAHPVWGCKPMLTSDGNLASSDGDFAGVSEKLIFVQAETLLPIFTTNCQCVVLIKLSGNARR